MPISKPIDVKFRGPTSSQEYNEAEKRKYADLVELFKQSNDSLLTLRESYNVVLAENHYLSIHAHELNQVMQELKAKITALENTGKVYIHSLQRFAKDMTTQYPVATQTTPEIPADIQKEYRLAKVSSIQSIPKTYLMDSAGAHFIPKELEVSVHRLHDKGEVIQNNLNNMFDGDETSYWQYAASYKNPIDAPINGEIVDLEIKLPLTLSHQLKINSISINPHPEKGVIIQDISVYYNGEWNQIDGFEQYEVTTASLNELTGKRKWIFEEKYAEKIKIRLMQPTGLLHNGKTNFYLGAQDVAIQYDVYTTSTSYVLTPFELDGIYDIHSVQHQFVNRKAISYSEFLEEELYNNIYTYQILWEGPDKILRTLKEEDWKNQTNKKLWIKTNLQIDPNNGVSPCLHSVKLNYTMH